MLKRNTMIRKLTGLLTAAAAASAVAMPVCAATFDDVAGHWAERYIEALSDKGYVGGYEGGLFCPDAMITRAEFAKLMVDSKGAQREGEAEFSDMEEGAWYAPYIRRAVAAGYLSGEPDGTVRPDDPILRQESAVVLARAFQKNGSGDVSGFTDAEQVAEWAKAAISGLAESGVLNGYEDGSIRPEANITRAETAKLAELLLGAAGGNGGSGGGGLIGGGSGGSHGTGSGSGGGVTNPVTFTLNREDQNLTLQTDTVRTISVASLASEAVVTAVSSDEKVVTAQGFDGTGEARLKVTALGAGSATVRFTASKPKFQNKTIAVAVTVAEPNQTVTGKVSGVAEDALVNITLTDTTNGSERFYTLALPAEEEVGNRPVLNIPSLLRNTRETLPPAVMQYELKVPQGSYSVEAQSFGYTMSDATVAVGEEAVEAADIRADAKTPDDLADDSLTDALLAKAEAMTQELWDSMDGEEAVIQAGEAVNSAKTALKIAQATLQGEKDETNAKALTEAYTTLERAMIRLAKAILQTELDKIDGLRFSDYVADSWDRYESAHVSAQKVCADAAAALPAVEAAAEALRQEREALTPNPAPVPPPQEPDAEAQAAALQKLIAASGTAEGSSEAALSLTLTDITDTGVTGAAEENLDSYRYTLMHANTEGYVTLTDRQSLQALIEQVNQKLPELRSALTVAEPDCAKAAEYVETADGTVKITLPALTAEHYFVHAGNNRIYLGTESREENAADDSFVYEYCNADGTFYFTPTEGDSAVPVNRAGIRLKAAESGTEIRVLQSDALENAASKEEIAFSAEKTGEIGGWHAAEGSGVTTIPYEQLELALPYVVEVAEDSAE